MSVLSQHVILTCATIRSERYGKVNKRRGRRSVSCSKRNLTLPSIAKWVKRYVTKQPVTVPRKNKESQLGKNEKYEGRGRNVKRV